MISAAAFGAVNAGLGLATSTIDIIRGHRMAKQAKEDLKNLKRPMMQVPQAQRQQVELYRQAMTGGMPGQQAAQYMMDRQNQMAMANAAGAATSSQDLLSVATALGEQGQTNQLALAEKAADFQSNAMSQYASGLGQLAQTQQEMFLTNQMDPFREKQAIYQANLQRGQGLRDQGFKGIGDTIGQSMPYFSAGGDNGKAGSSWERFRAMYGTPMTS